MDEFLARGAAAGAGFLDRLDLLPVAEGDDIQPARLGQPVEAGAALLAALAQQPGVQVGGKWYHTDAASKLHHRGNKDTARDQLAALYRQLNGLDD